MAGDADVVAVGVGRMVSVLRGEREYMRAPEFNVGRGPWGASVQEFEAFQFKLSLHFPRLCKPGWGTASAAATEETLTMSSAQAAAAPLDQLLCNAATELPEMGEIALPLRAATFWSVDRGLAHPGPHRSTLMGTLFAHSLFDEPAAVEFLDRVDEYAGTDLPEELGNAAAMYSTAIFWIVDCGLAHVGPGPVNTQGSSSCFQPAFGSPYASPAETDSKVFFLHDFPALIRRVL